MIATARNFNSADVCHVDVDMWTAELRWLKPLLSKRETYRVLVHVRAAIETEDWSP